MSEVLKSYLIITMADGKKKLSNELYFKDRYVKIPEVRRELWKDGYYDQMKVHKDFKGSWQRNRDAGGETKYKSQAHFLWKCILSESQKDTYREMTKVDSREEDNTTAGVQVEGMPNRQPPPYIPEAKENKVIRAPPLVERVSENKDVKDPLPPQNQKASRLVEQELNPGGETDDDPFCPNEKCGEYCVPHKGSKFCNQCGTKLTKFESMKNILEMDIPELFQKTILQNPDEKQKIRFKVKDFYNGNSQCVVARYNNYDGSNYMMLMNPDSHRINHFQIDSTKLSDIIIGLIEHKITNPICRNGVFLKSETNWWNKKLPHDTQVDFLYAPEVAHLKNGIQIHKDAYDYEGELVPHSDAVTCEFYGNGRISGEDSLLKKALSQIKEELFYSSKMRVLYTLSDIMSVLNVESKIINNFNVKDNSKLIEIDGLRVFIIDKRIDILLRIAGIRKEFAEISSFDFNVDMSEVLLILLGLMSIAAR